MASDSNYEGGTAVATQIETFTLNNDFNDSETAVTMTVTGEDDNTATAIITPTGVDETTIAAAWLVAILASTSPLFTRVTWTVSSNVITGTAKTSGVPFYAASSVTGGGGSITDSETTSSTGQHDWNTAANHEPSGVPASNQRIYLVPHPTDDKSYDWRYGLSQTSIDLRELRIPQTYKGSVGDSVNGFYALIDVSNVTTAAPIVTLSGRGEAYWLKGLLDTVYVKGSIPSKDAVQLAGTIDNLYIMGSDNQGTITVAASTNIDNIYIMGAAGATVKLGTSLASFDLLEMDSGNVLLESEPAASGIINVNGGILTIETRTWVNSSTINVRAPGIVRFNSGGTINALNVFGGQFDLDGNQSSGITMTTTIQWGGLISANSGLSNYTWSTATRHGGISTGDVVMTDVSV